MATRTPRERRLFEVALAMGFSYSQAWRKVDHCLKREREARQAAEDEFRLRSRRLGDRILIRGKRRHKPRLHT